MPIFSLSTIEDKKVIKSGDRKNIETTVDKGKLANATKKKYMAITKHIPLIANKITVRRGRSKTFLAPFPTIEITKIQNKARITTI